MLKSVLIILEVTLNPINNQESFCKVGTVVDESWKFWFSIVKFKINKKLYKKRNKL